MANADREHGLILHNCELTGQKKSVFLFFIFYLKVEQVELEHLDLLLSS